MAETIARLRKLPEDTMLTVNITLTPEFHLRVWLGTWLLRAAAWVMGCGIEVGDGGNGDTAQP